MTPVLQRSKKAEKCNWPGQTLVLLGLLLYFLPLSGQNPDTFEVSSAIPDTSETLTISCILAYDPAYPVLLFERGDSLFLAQKGGLPWVYWNVPNMGVYNTTYGLERRDVNGDHQDEILVWWEQRMGHSGWGGGNISSEEGILVWDIRQSACILNLTYAVQNESWWQEVEEPEEGAEASDSLVILDSGQSLEGHTFSIEFSEEGVLRLDSLKTTGEDWTIDVQMGNYRFENDCFRRSEE